MRRIDQGLPGDPPKILVRRVRAALRMLGVDPGIESRERWHRVWEWARNIRNSYADSNRKWPYPFEIEAMYWAVLLAEMRRTKTLLLPHRARSRLYAEALMPAELRALITPEPLALPAPDDEESAKGTP